MAAGDSLCGAGARWRGEWSCRRRPGDPPSSSEYCRPGDSGELVASDLGALRRRLRKGWTESEADLSGSGPRDGSSSLAVGDAEGARGSVASTSQLDALLPRRRNTACHGGDSTGERPSLSELDSSRDSPADVKLVVDSDWDSTELRREVGRRVDLADCLRGRRGCAYVRRDDLALAGRGGRGTEGLARFNAAIICWFCTWICRKRSRRPASCSDGTNRAVPRPHAFSARQWSTRGGRPAVTANVGTVTACAPPTRATTGFTL